nr:MAG TPA: hypothetical protein [Caudoviricetes sp.]
MTRITEDDFQNMNYKTYLSSNANTVFSRFVSCFIFTH